MKRSYGWMVLAALLATACGGEEQVEPAPHEPEEPAPEPVPEHDWRARRDWHVRGNAFVRSIEIADVDGDGADELIVGGRRPAVLDAATGVQRWWFDWTIDPDDPLYVGGDTDGVSAIAAVPGDGGADVLTIDEDGHAWRIDGATGALEWKRTLDLRFDSGIRMTLFGDPAAPLFFAVTGYAAHDARTGDESWPSPLPTWPTYLVAAARGEGEPTGLFAGHQHDIFRDGNEHVGEASIAGSHDGEHGERFSGVHAITPDGTLVFTKRFAEGVQLMGLAAGDLDGDGHDEALAILEDGTLHAIDASGETLWERTIAPYGDPRRGMIVGLHAADGDHDGADEIYVVVGDGRYGQEINAPHVVLALGADGTELWRHNFSHRAWNSSLHTVDGEPALVIGAGPDDGINLGAAVVVRLAPEAMDRGTAFELPVRPDAIAVRAGEGSDELVAAAWDGTIRSLAADGSLSWHAYLGGLIMTVAPIDDGDETLGFALADVMARISFVDRDGTTVWHRSMDLGLVGWASGLATGPLGSGATPSVVGIARTQHEAGNGAIAAYSASGALTFARHTAEVPLAVAIGRFAGGAEIAVLQGEMQTALCELMLLDATGREVSRTQLVRCGGGVVEHGDVDADGVEEIAVRLDPPDPSEPSFVIFARGDGEILWGFDEIDVYTQWLKVVPGALLQGGAAVGGRGFVVRRDAATGQRTWNVQVDPLPDLSNPVGPLVVGAAAHAALVPDRDGDGIDELAVSSVTNELFLLDGATGEIRWQLQTETSEIPSAWRHDGGRLTWVPDGEGRPGHLVLAEVGGNEPARSSVHFVSPEGRVEAVVPIESSARAIVTARGGSDGPQAVVAGIFGLYATSVADNGGAE